MYDETDSRREPVFEGEVLPPGSREVASKPDFDPVERRLKLAVQRAARGLVVTAGCYYGYKLWKAMSERG